MVLVDTSSWIEYLRGKTSEPSLRVAALMEAGEASLCDIVLVELWSGAKPGAEKGNLEKIEVNIPCLPINLGVWKTANKLAFLCKRNGLSVPVADVIIASCGFYYQVPIEAFDSHFRAISLLARTSNFSK